MSPRSVFEKRQEKRDAAAALLGLGTLLFLLSGGLLLASLIGGYGWVGWLSYFAGPVTLGLSLPLLFFGARYAKAAGRKLEE